jgi:hypothetical protein
VGFFASFMSGNVTELSSMPCKNCGRQFIDKGGRPQNRHRRRALAGTMVDLREIAKWQRLCEKQYVTRLEKRHLPHGEQ